MVALHTSKLFFPYIPNFYIIGIIYSAQNKNITSFKRLWLFKGWVLHNHKAKCNNEARKYMLRLFLGKSKRHYAYKLHVINEKHTCNILHEKHSNRLYEHGKYS